MARNEEKAQALLNRFVTAKRAANRDDKTQRPYLATECEDLDDCELYRGQIIRDLSKKVSLIQNEGLDEHRVRDLNDQINKLIREKGHWERQIKKLGGADHFRTAPQMFAEDEAEEVVPGRGYRYFGAAKKLPGVKELFRKKAPEREKRTRFEMMKGIDADYYGYRDEDDGILEDLERAAEAEALRTQQAEWHARKVARLASGEREAEDEDEAEADDDAEGAYGRPAESAERFHLELPDRAAIEAKILEKRKKEMLAALLPGALAPVETHEPRLVPKSW